MTTSFTGRPWPKSFSAEGFAAHLEQGWTPGRTCAPYRTERASRRRQRYLPRGDRLRAGVYRETESHSRCDTHRDVTSQEVRRLKEENEALKRAVAETVLDNQRLKKVWACKAKKVSANGCRIQTGSLAGR